MKAVGTSYTVDLNTAEISEIASALHEQYMKHREGGGDCTVIRELQTLRNDFAKLINKSYMGYDA